MKLSIKKGTQSKLIQFFIQDSAVTTGAGKTALSATSASVTAYYYREGNSVSTVIPMTNASLGVFAAGGFVAVDGTNMPGLYQFGVPDAALATGASSVVLMINGASGAAPVLAEIQLVDYNPEDSVRMGLTALPNVAAGENGGLPLGDANGDVSIASIGSSAVDAIWAKTYPSLGGVPVAGVSTVLDVIGWLGAMNINKRTQTATLETLFAAGGTDVGITSTKSDNGTTFTRGEYEAGLVP